MLSLHEMKRATQILNERFQGARIQGVFQSHPQEVVLALYRSGEASEDALRSHLILSCRPEFGRIALTKRKPQTRAPLARFCQFLRAHIDGARIEGVSLRGEDRQASFLLRTSESQWELLLSLMGPRSNLYLLDAAGVLRESLRPLAETRRKLSLGSAWSDPETSPPQLGEDRFADVHGDAYLERIQTHYQASFQEQDSQDAIRPVLQAFKKALSAYGRKKIKLEAELSAGEKANDWNRKGELLKSVLGDVVQGQSEVTATDYSSGESCVISLDPTLSPKQNLERYFKRYRKCIKQVTLAGQQLAELDERVAVLEKMREELNQLVEKDLGHDEVAAFLSNPNLRRALSRYLPKPKPAEKKSEKGSKKDLPAKLRPRRFCSRDGLEIWVGRSDAGNDYLTTRLARGRDLFFHLEGAPGSHVVLRTEGRDDPPQESILDACELAVHYSKQKNTKRAGVHVAPIKYVRKPKGAKPGLVYVSNGKNVDLRRSDSRLRRVLDSRIDE